MISVLAIDPGPTRSGAAVLEVDAEGWPRCLRGAHLHNADLRTWVDEAVQRGRIVAVEEIVGYAYQASRVAGLVETARVEGMLLERAAGGRAITMSAADWRLDLCGSRTASDAQIRRVVEALVLDLPRVRADERAHIYDAAGLALVVLARQRGMRLQVPADVVRELHMVRAHEKATRASKPRERRSPTRAQSERRSKAARRARA